MSIEKQQYPTIEKSFLPTIEKYTAGGEVAPTSVPGVPTFDLTALPAAIRIDISRTSGINRAQGHRVRIRRRNAADTAWEAVQAWIDIGNRRSYIFTQYTRTQVIEVGRRYEVKAIAYNVIGDSPEGDYIEVVPLTNIPAIPTFTLEPHDAAIRITLNKVDDPLNNPIYPLYSYDMDKRNDDDTDWVSQGNQNTALYPPISNNFDIYDIVSDTDTQLVVDITKFIVGFHPTEDRFIEEDLINGREYRIRVNSLNQVNFSAWSAWMSATPMMGVMPAQRPGLPTFSFAPLRYDYDTTGDEITASVNFNPRPNADGVGVTHWLFRYRENGTATWQTQTVVAQPELDTVYGFRLDEDDIGDTYEVQVASRNDAGDSAYTSSQTIVITTPLPQAPVFSIVYHPFVWGIALDFQLEPTDQLSPVLPITGYGWRFRIVGTTTWTTAESTISPFYASEAPSNAIGRQIEVQMRSINAAGNGDWSSSQRLQIIDVPNRPDLFLTAQAGGFDVRIVNSPAGYRAVGFGFRYREQGTTDWTGGSTLEIRNLDGLTAYEVQAWTENPAGRSLPVSRTVTTLAVMRVRGRLAVYGRNLAVYGDNLKVYGGE